MHLDHVAQPTKDPVPLVGDVNKDKKKNIQMSLNNGGKPYLSKNKFQ